MQDRGFPYGDGQTDAGFQARQADKEIERTASLFHRDELTVQYGRRR